MRYQGINQQFIECFCQQNRTRKQLSPKFICPGQKVIGETLQGELMGVFDEAITFKSTKA